MMTNEFIIGDLLLRDIRNEDYEFLLKWRNSFNYLQFCTSRPAVSSIGELIDELRQDIINKRRLEFKVIEHKRNGVVGQIFSYIYSNRPNDYFVTIFFDTNFERAGYGVSTIIIYGSYILKKHSIDYFFCEAVIENSHSIKVMDKAGFEFVKTKNRLVNSTNRTIREYRVTQHSLNNLTRYLKPEQRDKYGYC